MGKGLGLLVFCVDQYRKGTNVLLVKGTAHTGTRARTTMITSASSDVGRLKNLKNDDN